MREAVFRRGGRVCGELVDCWWRLTGAPRERGEGLRGGEVFSPGMSVGGTGRSSTGKRGSPVRRLRTKVHAGLGVRWRWREWWPWNSKSSGSACGVVIPDVVMDELEGPEFACRCGRRCATTELASAVVTGAEAAVEIRGEGAAGGDVDDAAGECRRRARTRRCRRRFGEFCLRRPRARGSTTRGAVPVRASKPRTIAGFYVDCLVIADG